jgi:hypothetical protein
MSGQRIARSEYDLARELIEDAVPQHIEAWAATIGLKQKDALFEQFREDVTEALHACMRAHNAVSHNRHKRYSDLGRDFTALAKAAEATVQQLRGVEYILKRLPPMQHDPAFRLVHDPHATAFEQDGLAKAARLWAHECRRADRGGRQPMTAFRLLADGLVRAYSRATKRKGTGGNVREGRSRLRALVEAVLPTARKIAKDVTGKSLKAPARGGLGYRLDEIAKRSLKGAQPPRI